MDLAPSKMHLFDYWSVLVRRRWIVYLSVISVTVTALIGSFIVTPIYRATTVLQIERQSPDVLTFRDLSQVDYSWAAYSDFYETQYKIISSTAVARKAAERLELTSHPDFAPGASSPGLIARLRSLIPRRGASVKMEPIDIAAAMVQGGLAVSPVRNSHLVHVSYVSDDPDLAARIANAVGGAYIQYTIESQYSATGEAESFLVDQIGLLRREIAAIEDQLQVYGEAKGIVSIDDASNITLRALQDVSARRTEAQTALARAQAAYDAVLKADPEDLPEVLNSELITRLRQESALYEAQYTEKSKQFHGEWPDLLKLKSKLDQSHARLDLEVERVVRQARGTAEAEFIKAREQVDNLDRLLREQETAAQRLKRDAVEFADYQGEVQKKRETLSALLARQNEMALSTRLKDLDSTSTNIRIMEPARPPAAPFRPNTRLNLALGMLLGLALGAGTAFFLNYLDNTIATPGDLEKILSIPVLATIPRHETAAAQMPRSRRRMLAAPAKSFDLVTHLDGQASASEAYRELRTSILLSHPGQPPGRIMVTSALPEEGKTATVMNLAVVLAQLGRRVVIVDTDLRRPRLHRAFGKTNRSGVSTYLSGLEQDPTRLIISTGVDQLDLMPSGPVPPNPSELLNSPRFEEMGRELLDRGYDHVVFDSPPALSVSDPVIIASVVDTGVLVVRAGRTPRQSVRAAAAKFEQAAIGPFGVVLNDVDPQSQGASYYRYHYHALESADAEDSETQPARDAG